MILFGIPPTSYNPIQLAGCHFTCAREFVIDFKHHLYSQPTTIDSEFQQIDRQTDRRMDMCRRDSAPSENFYSPGTAKSPPNFKPIELSNQRGKV